MLYIQTGVITGVMSRYVNVTLHNTGQTIKAVKCSPLDLDEREETPQINNGTEALVIIDDLGNAYAIASMSQGIAAADNDTSTLCQKNVFIGGAQGAIGETVDMFSSKVKIRNDTGELFEILSTVISDLKSLADAVKSNADMLGNTSASDTANSVSSSSQYQKTKSDSFI